MKKSDTIAMELSKYISMFLTEYAPNHLTGSENTVRSYESALSLYLGFLEEQGVTASNFNSNHFEHEYLEKWLEWLKVSRKCSDTTCNNRLASLKAFIKYLSGRQPKYLYLVNDVISVKTRKVHRNKVVGMSRAAVKALMEEPDANDRTGLRDLVFMVVLYATAARFDEILSIKMKNLHLDKGKPCVSIVGKGDKLRTLYLLPKAVSHLRLYIREYHTAVPDPEAYLFYSKSKGTCTKMTQPAISKRLKLYAEAANKKCPDVPLDLHSHQFRHAKASHWLEDGMNIVQISFLLGHAQLETTMIYLDITTEQEAAAMATLETENDKKITAKWKGKTDGLSALCGIKPLKK